MVNDLAAMIPQILAQALEVTRENEITARLVNRTYDNEAAKKGDTIEIPVTSAVTVSPVVPAATPPATADTTLTNILLPLDQWHETAWYITEKEEVEVMNGVFPAVAQEHVKALVNFVGTDILSEYKKVYNTHGTASTPFATDTTDAAQIQKLLNDGLAPNDQRFFLLNTAAQANAINLRAFQDTAWNANAQGINEGQIGRKLGFDWHLNQNLLSIEHVAGTGTGYLMDGVNAIGATSINVDTGSGTFEEGDIITIAGDTQTYVVRADVASVAAVVTIQPALRVATTGGEAVSIKSSHSINLAFQRQAIAFATRRLPDNSSMWPSMSMMDDISGMSMRVEIKPEHKRKRVSFEMLWGVQTIRPGFAARLSGALT